MEPVTTACAAVAGLSWVGFTASVGAGLAATATDRLACQFVRGVKDRVAGLGSAPEIHDVARAVRTAQIQALERVIGDYRALGRPEWTTDPATRPDMFFERSARFYDGALRRCRDLSVELNLEVMEPLSAAIDDLLASPAHDGPASERADALAFFAEQAVLDELVEAPDGVVLPDGFEAHFRAGAGDRPRFLEAFGAFIAKQLGEGGPFHRIFVTARLAHIAGLTFDATEMIARIETRFGNILDRLAADTAKISATQDAQGEMLAELLARQKGVPTETLKAILAKLGEAHVPDDQIAARLEAKADELIALRDQWSRLTDDHPDVVAVRQDALAKIDDGDLDGARALLTTARQRVREIRLERSREEASLLADEAALDRLEIRYRAAAEKYAEAAKIVSNTDATETQQEYDLAQASCLYDHGNEFGDNAALLVAIERYQAIVSRLDRSKRPLHWAATLNGLGNALWALGKRESGTDRLEQAVDAYGRALEERTRERVPLDWAMTQNNLGAALQTLGERESGTDRLEQAVDAYGRALQERTRERVPLDWAMTQNNLGAALQTLGERESGTQRLEQAITAYRRALQERTRERVPLNWATTQNNLGNALCTLGKRESGTDRFRQAVEACRLALEERTRKRAPLLWSSTHNNLGNALLALGERESGTDHLEKAVAAYRLALTEWTRENVPLDWAATQNNLGTALSILGERESGTERLEQAAEALAKALEVFQSAGADYYVEVVSGNLAGVQELLWDRRGQ